MNDIFIREHIIRYTECVVLRPEKPYLIPPLSYIKNFRTKYVTPSKVYTDDGGIK